MFINSNIIYNIENYKTPDVSPDKSIDKKNIRWQNNIHNSNLKYILKYCMSDLIDEVYKRRSQQSDRVKVPG